VGVSIVQKPERVVFIVSLFPIKPDSEPLLNQRIRVISREITMAETTLFRFA
jgi:hypothetical protein